MPRSYFFMGKWSDKDIIYEECTPKSEPLTTSYEVKEIMLEGIGPLKVIFLPQLESNEIHLLGDQDHVKIVNVGLERSESEK